MTISDPPTKSSNKSIDWELCLKLANGKQAFAKEMLVMFIDDLPKARDSIMSAFKKQDWEELQHQVHRLHGACCYCGVPKLKQLTRQIETALKQNQTATAKALIPKVDRETNEILTCYKRNDYQK